MRNSREQALVIKGFLLHAAAPADLLSSMDMIIDQLGEERITISGNIPIKAPAIGDLVERFISRRRDLPERKISTPGSSLREVIKHVPETNFGSIPDVAKKEEILNASPEHGQDLNTSAEATAPEKKKKVMPAWTDERRAKQAEIMRQRRAAGFDPVKVGAERKKTAEVSTHSQANSLSHSQTHQVSPETPQVIAQTPKVTPVLASEAPSKASTQQDEYIGTRTDGFLVKEDLGDIRRMISNGLPETRVARSYSVTVEVLRDFLAEHKDVHTGK